MCASALNAQRALAGLTPQNTLKQVVGGLFFSHHHRLPGMAVFFEEKISGCPSPHQALFSNFLIQLLANDPCVLTRTNIVQMNHHPIIELIMEHGLDGIFAPTIPFAG